MCDANVSANANTNDFHTSNANSRKVRYAGAVEVFFSKTPSCFQLHWPWWQGTCFCYLAFAFAFALPRSTRVKCKSKHKCKCKKTKHFPFLASALATTSFPGSTVVHTCIFLRLHLRRTCEPGFTTEDY